MCTRLETKNNWCIPGHAAFALRPVRTGTVRDLAGGRTGPSEEEEVRAEALKEAEEE